MLYLKKSNIYIYDQCLLKHQEIVLIETLKLKYKRFSMGRGFTLTFCGVIIPTAYNKATSAELKWESNAKR